jgi:hypothetical protein
MFPLQKVRRTFCGEDWRNLTMPSASQAIFRRLPTVEAHLRSYGSTFWIFGAQVIRTIFLRGCPFSLSVITPPLHNLDSSIIQRMHNGPTIAAASGYIIDPHQRTRSEANCTFARIFVNPYSSVFQTVGRRPPVGDRKQYIGSSSPSSYSAR